MKALAGDRTLCVITFCVCVAISLSLSAVGWHHNLIEGHEFRQTQTAMTAQYIKTEGWSLAYPLPLFGPPWSAPMEFPFYQLCVAKISAFTGCPIEPTGRVVSLAFLYLSLPAFFLLLRHLGIGRDRRWLYLGLVVVTPVYQYYSRVFMIESTALCAAAWFLHAYCRAVETLRYRYAIAAIVLGAFAALAKSTTFAVFLIPAAIFLAWQCRQKSPSISNSAPRRAARIGAAVLIVCAALAAGFGWVHYSDTVKSSNPLSDFLTSAHLSNWNFGPLRERFQPEFWQNILTISTHSVLQTADLLFFACFGLFLSRVYRRRILVLVGCCFAGPLAFANLYSIHDYYHYATGVFLLGALFLAWCELLDWHGVPRAGKWLVIGTSLGIHVVGFTSNYFHIQTRENIDPPELGKIIRRVTAPDDVLLIYGLEWNPLLPYTAGRKAIMIPGSSINDPRSQDEAISRVPPEKIAALILVGDLRFDRDLIARLFRTLPLEAAPLLTNEETHVYVSRRLVPAAVASLRKFRPLTFRLNAPPDDELFGIKVWRFNVADLPDPTVVSMFSPAPSAILTPYGVAATTIGGRRTFGAHAPTEVFIALSADRHHFSAGFGLSPETYLGPQKTDGVEFVVELRSPDKETVVLFDRLLTPATKVGDRGLQHVEFDLPRTTGGNVVLRTLPGPSLSNSFDWSYWTDVEIK